MRVDPIANQASLSDQCLQNFYDSTGGCQNLSFENAVGRSLSSSELNLDSGLLGFKPRNRIRISLEVLKVETAERPQNSTNGRKKEKNISSLLMGVPVHFFVVDTETHRALPRDCVDYWEGQIDVKVTDSGLYDLHCWVGGEPIGNSPLPLQVGVGDLCLQNCSCTLREYLLFHSSC